jgi:hypothetical protein
MLATADLTATATPILAGITLCLMLATVGLVVATANLVTSTRKAAAQAREASQRELKLLERQLESTYRPLLVDVLTEAPPLEDAGASSYTSGGVPLIQIVLPGMGMRMADPRFVFVLIEKGHVFISVPLRNVGRGLAVIDGGGVELGGAALGAMEYRTIRRYHVPVGESTRIDLIMGYRMNERISAPGEVWTLTVPYADFAGEQGPSRRCRSSAAETTPPRGRGSSSVSSRQTAPGLSPPRWAHDHLLQK